MGVSRWPVCSVRVSDVDWDDMTVLFFENTTSSWVLQQTNNSIVSGSVVVWGNYSNASLFDTVFWWQCGDKNYW